MNKNIVYEIDVTLRDTFRHCMSWELAQNLDISIWSTLDSELELPNRIVSVELRSEMNRMIGHE